MKHLKIGTSGLLLLSLLLFSCGAKKEDATKKEGKVDELASTGIPEVKVVLLSEGGFRQENVQKTYGSDNNFIRTFFPLHRHPTNIS